MKLGLAQSPGSVHWYGNLFRQEIGLRIIGKLFIESAVISSTIHNLPVLSMENNPKI